MKRIIIYLALILPLILLSACSDNSTSSQQTTVITDTKFIRNPDSLAISFNISGTKYSFTQLDSGMQFTGNTKIAYNIRVSEGAGTFSLYNIDDSVIFNKPFNSNIGDTISLYRIPWKYYFNLTNFTGSGNIYVVKKNTK